MLLPISHLCKDFLITDVEPCAVISGRPQSVDLSSVDLSLLLHSTADESAGIDIAFTLQAEVVAVVVGFDTELGQVLSTCIVQTPLQVCLAFCVICAHSVKQAWLRGSWILLAFVLD
jgi:hypothetical protein